MSGVSRLDWEMMMRIAGILMCIGLAAGCAKESMNDGDDPLGLVAELRNSDVPWDGTRIGLMPLVEGDVAKRLIADRRKFPYFHILLVDRRAVSH